MAAHVINAMNEFTHDLYEFIHKEVSDQNKEFINQKCQRMYFALGHAKFGDLFDYKDWEVIYYALECNAFKSVIYFWWLIQDKYNQEWEKLNRPETAEIWFNRKYS